ncbi:PREDICTED: cytochrome P450 2J2-like [Elephantulus edwardii]|uniref:cytochrome P450 2J2-like n=1 Tax=Elephantulus edwardii TaxID=28737 RepID=UPI0003F068AA|nr:PREDICTED: cytochrome P450 2J2-like [Elephantulus edwardii]
MLAALGSLASALWAGLHLRTLLLGAFFFLFFVDFLKSRRPKNYPPRPPRLPFLGNFFQLDIQQPHETLQKLMNKYGNLFSVEFGHFSTVLVSGMPLIKEVLTRPDQSLLNRPLMPIRERIFKRNGLIMSSGQEWKEQRRFALTTLRNFGLGKKSLEERIQEEARYLTDAIQEEKGQPFDPHFKINNAVSNIICSVTFGERFEYDDTQFQELLKLLDKAIHLESSLWCHLYNIFPWIMKFLPGSHQTVIKYWEKLKMFVIQVIENHRRDWNPDQPRDFIDAYLMEMAKHLEQNDEKVQAEIDRVLGQTQQPSMANRDQMPYTNAVIHEVQRMGNIIPLNAPREVAFDTTLGGYDLPKGTMVMTNLTALHRDPKEWATPDTFNPEHFLENGQFKKRESFMPFSIGKRVCIGEQLARAELFIFFTSLVQKFTFRPPANEKLSLKFRTAITLSPASYRICAIPRA